MRVVSSGWKSFLPEFCLLLFAALALFLNADVFEIDPYTEFFHIEAAKESLAANQFWIPVLHGRSDLVHPPLWTWITMLSFRIFGVSLWAARLPALLSALLGVCATYLLMMEVSKRRFSALFSAIILATVWGYFYLGTLSTPDILAVPLYTGFLWVGLRWLAIGKRKNVSPVEIKLFSFLMGALLGLLVLTQGMPGVLILLLVALAYPLICGERLYLAKLHMGLFFGAACAIPFPWLFVASVGSRDALFAFNFLFVQPVERFSGLGTWSMLQRDGWFHLRRLALDLLPYLPFFPLALPEVGLWPVRHVSTTHVHPPRWPLWLFIWFVGGLLIYSFSTFQTPSMLLPFYPAFAMLTGHGMGRLVETHSEKNTAYTVALMVCVAAMMIGAVVYTALIFQVLPVEYVAGFWHFPGQAIVESLKMGPFHLNLGEEAFPLWKLWLAPGAFILLMGGLTLFVLQAEQRLMMTPAALMGVTWLFLLFIKGVYGPILQHSAPVAIAREINRHVPPGAPIVLYDLTPDVKRVLFYIDAERLSGVRLVRQPAQIRSYLRGKRPFSGVIQEQDFFHELDAATRFQLQIRHFDWAWDVSRSAELRKFLVIRPPRFTRMQSGLIYFQSLPPLPEFPSFVLPMGPASSAAHKP